MWKMNSHVCSHDTLKRPPHELCGASECFVAQCKDKGRTGKDGRREVAARCG